MSIVITSTENLLIEAFKQHNINITVDNLLIGDVHIKHNDKVVYIIERKAKTDLDASIKDGRYKEQKSRLIESGISVKNIIYLIEQLKIPNDLSKSRIWGAICNSQHRDGITVFQTKDINETVVYINTLAKSVEKFPPDELLNKENDSKSNVNVNIKKKTVSEKDWFLHSLTLIPKCSLNIAKVIIETYPTFKTLITAIEENGDTCLADLRHGASQRRLGNKLSQEICNIIIQHK